MKTKLLLLVLFLPLIFQAQLLHYGAKAGLNLADAYTGIIYTSPNNRTLLSNSQSITFGVDTSPLVSFYIGGFTEFSFTKKSQFTLQLELIYAQNGTSINAKKRNENDYISYTTEGGKIKVSQLTIPVLVKFYPKNNFSIDGGIYTGYVFGIKTINASGLTVDYQNELINKIDFGLILGTTYNLKNNMFFELRYNFGLIDLDRSFESFYGDTFETFYKNRTFHLGIGYKFK